MKTAEEYLRAKVVGGKMLPYTKRMMIEVMEEYARDYADWSLKDITKAYELEQEQNILLAQKCSDYADIVTSLEQRLKNSNDRHAEREKEVEFWKDAYNRAALRRADQ